MFNKHCLQYFMNFLEYYIVIKFIPNHIINFHIILETLSFKQTNTSNINKKFDTKK
jgi:hypothetical protein